VSTYCFWSEMVRNMKIIYWNYGNQNILQNLLRFLSLMLKLGSRKIFDAVIILTNNLVFLFLMKQCVRSIELTKLEGILNFMINFNKFQTYITVGQKISNFQECQSSLSKENRWREYSTLRGKPLSFNEIQCQHIF
jgi:hypothetical protein